MHILTFPSSRVIGASGYTSVFTFFPSFNSYADKLAKPDSDGYLYPPSGISSLDLVVVLFSIFPEVSSFNDVSLLSMSSFLLPHPVRSNVAVNIIPDKTVNLFFI